MKAYTTNLTGKKVEVEVMKKYDENSMEVNFDGFWFVVRNSDLEYPKVNVRTKYEYEGKSQSTDSDSRDVVITMTGDSVEAVEMAHELLMGLMGKYGYEVANCSQAEEVNGKWVMVESVNVEDPKEAKDVKEVYKEFKAMVK